MSESVNHPKHYQTQGGIEVIEMIEALGFGEGFCIGNAIKYAGRAGKKDSTKYIEDLEKAVWYLKRRIEIAKAEQEGRTITRPNDMNPRTPSLTEHTAKLVEELKTKDSSATLASTSFPSQSEPPTDAVFDVSESPQLRAETNIYIGDGVEIDFARARVRAWKSEPRNPLGDFNVHGTWYTITPEGQKETVAFIPDPPSPWLKEEHGLDWLSGKNCVAKLFFDPEKEQDERQD